MRPASTGCQVRLQRLVELSTNQCQGRRTPTPATIRMVSSLRGNTSGHTQSCCSLTSLTAHLGCCRFRCHPARQPAHSLHTLHTRTPLAAALAEHRQHQPAEPDMIAGQDGAYYMLYM